MIPTPSPITPTEDQAAAIAWLEAAGTAYGADVDAAPLPETARGACDNDSAHDLGTVCTRDGYLCLPCALNWLSWHPGQLVSPEVLRLPAAESSAA